MRKLVEPDSLSVISSFPAIDNGSDNNVERGGKEGCRRAIPIDNSNAQDIRLAIIYRVGDVVQKDERIQSLQRHKDAMECGRLFHASYLGHKDGYSNKHTPVILWLVAH